MINLFQPNCLFSIQGRTNLPPEKVPWDALATLMSQCIYGGKIDNEFDQRLLTSFLSKLFTPKSFDPEFPLVSKVDGKKDCTVLIHSKSLIGYIVSIILIFRVTTRWLNLCCCHHTITYVILNVYDCIIQERIQGYDTEQIYCNYHTDLVRKLI